LYILYEQIIPTLIFNLQAGQLPHPLLNNAYP